VSLQGCICNPTGPAGLPVHSQGYTLTQTPDQDKPLDHIPPAMGFLSVPGMCSGNIREHVPVSCCSFSLFPEGSPLPPTSFLSLTVTQKKSLAKKKTHVFVFPRHSKGQKGMEDDNMQSVHGPEAARLLSNTRHKQRLILVLVSHRLWYVSLDLHALTLSRKGNTAGKRRGSESATQLKSRADRKQWPTLVPADPLRTCLQGIKWRTVQMSCLIWPCRGYRTPC